MLTRARVVAATLVAVLGLVSLVHVLYAGFGPLPDRAERQLGFLDAALASGRDTEMQGLFPEGEYFTRVLTGLAEAQVAARLGTGAGSAGYLDRARSRLAAIETLQSVAVFGSGMVPDHGIFAAGWSLALAVAVARASGSDEDRTAVRERALVVHSALTQRVHPSRPATRVSFGRVIQSWQRARWPRRSRCSICPGVRISPPGGSGLWPPPTRARAAPTPGR